MDAISPTDGGHARSYSSYTEEDSEFAALLSPRSSLEISARSSPEPSSFLHFRREYTLRKIPGNLWARKYLVAAILTLLLLGVTYHSFSVTHQKYQMTMEAEMIPVPARVNSLVPSEKSGISNHAEVLQDRFKRVNMPQPAACSPLSQNQIEKYASLKETPPILVALNLHSSQHVLPTLSRAILDLAEFIGTDKLYVSIFENGSWDNTKIGLAHLGRVLDSMGVSNYITTDQSERPTDWDKVDRIAQLAVYRNIVIKPLLTNHSDLPDGWATPDESEPIIGGPGIDKSLFSSVLFINDVFLCLSDVLELIWQKQMQGANAACAMDWRYNAPRFDWLVTKSVKFYDNWVSRSITGSTFRNRLDLFGEYRDGIGELFTSKKDLVSRIRIKHGLPFPVYSCWNGVIVVDSAPMQNDKLPVKFRSLFNVSGECAASECKTLARDYWKLNLRKWMVVPSVHVTYEEKLYYDPFFDQLSPQPLSHTTSTTPFMIPGEKIDWSSVNPPEDVACYAWERGFHIDSLTKGSPFRR